MNNSGFEKRFADFKNKLEHFKYAKEHYFFSFKKDPLANFLILKLKMSPCKGMVLAFLLTVTVYAFGYVSLLLTDKHIVGISTTYLDFFYDIIILPATFGFYIWLSTVPAYTLLKISQAYEKFEAVSEFPKLASELIQKQNQRIVFLLSFAMAVFLGINSVIHISHEVSPLTNYNLNQNFFYYVKIPVLWFVSWYMVAVIALKMFIFIFMLRRILTKIVSDLDKNAIKNLKILEPVRDFLKNITYFLGACGSALTVLAIRGYNYGYFHNKWIIYIGMIVYLFVSFFIFIFPLHPFYITIKKIRKYNMEKKNILKIRMPFIILPDYLLRNFLIAVCLPPIFLMFFLICT